MDISGRLNRVTKFLARNHLDAHSTVSNARGEAFPLADIILGAITQEMLFELKALENRCAEAMGEASNPVEIVKAKEGDGEQATSHKV